LTERGLAARLAGTIALGPYVATERGVAALEAEVATALSGFHTRMPSAPGPTAETLRLAMPTRLTRAAFAALLAHVIDRELVTAEGHLVRAAGHRGGMAAEEARCWAALRPLLEAIPNRPPLLREAADRLGLPEVALRRACKGFSRAGLLVEMAPDRFFPREAALGLAAAAHALSAEVPGGAFTAAQFRDRVGTGRQVAIQVLDYLDRRGITVRRGDLRRAGKDPAAVFGPSGHAEALRGASRSDGTSRGAP
jgi:selenocysteine-specific elongation factor